MQLYVTVPHRSAPLVFEHTSKTLLVARAKELYESGMNDAVFTIDGARFSFPEEGNGKSLPSAEPLALGPTEQPASPPEPEVDQAEPNTAGPELPSSPTTQVGAPLDPVANAERIIALQNEQLLRSIETNAAYQRTINEINAEVAKERLATFHMRQTDKSTARENERAELQLEMLRQKLTKPSGFDVLCAALATMMQTTVVIPNK